VGISASFSYQLSRVKQRQLDKSQGKSNPFLTTKELAVISEVGTGDDESADIA